MDYKSQFDRQKELFSCFTDLPKKMLNLHEQSNLAEFVLHNICNPDCLNISKAAYFIDNPDFNKLIGIAGFDRESHIQNLSDRNKPWQEPHEFSNHMCSCEFNQRVRKIDSPSSISAKTQDSYLKLIAEELAFETPSTYIWDTKHSNHGILIFENNDYITNLDPKALDIICMLGFCPVF